MKLRSEREVFTSRTLVCAACMVVGSLAAAAGVAIPNAASAISGFSLLVAGLLAIEATFSSAQVSPNDWVRERCRSRSSVLGCAFDRVLRPWRIRDSDQIAEPLLISSPLWSRASKFPGEPTIRRDNNTALALVVHAVRNLEYLLFSHAASSFIKGLGLARSSSRSKSFFESGVVSLVIEELEQSMVCWRLRTCGQKEEEAGFGEEARSLALPLQTMIADLTQLLSRLSESDPNYTMALRAIHKAQQLRSTTDSALEFFGRTGWVHREDWTRTSLDKPIRKAISVLSGEAAQERRSILLLFPAEERTFPDVLTAGDDLTLSFVSILRNAIHNSFDSAGDDRRSEILMECDYAGDVQCEIRVKYIGVHPVGSEADPDPTVVQVKEGSQLKGIGYGLFFARMAIRRHGGSVSVTGEASPSPGGGFPTTLQIRLPVSRNDDRNKQ